LQEFLVNLIIKRIDGDEERTKMGKLQFKIFNSPPFLNGRDGQRKLTFRPILTSFATGATPSHW
jgi:hypothetical protein